MATTNWPLFYFRAREMRPHPRRALTYDALQRWCPPMPKGHNVLRKTPLVNMYWACNGQMIAQVPAAAVPASSTTKFRTYSVYHCQDTFYVVDFDATRQAVGEVTTPAAASPGPDDDPDYAGWQRMKFQHSPGSSFASLAGGADRLGKSRPDSIWTTRLLPPAYHGPSPGYSEGAGMNGHLPLLLALILHSYERGRAVWVLENLFRNGAWLLHPGTGAWEDKRGIVVDVWTWPGYTDATRLRAFESGPIFQ